MLPYYFAPGHLTYVRYGLYYLHSMEKLPPHVQTHFMKGEHITRHIRGIWNGIWSDQFIESTFMRYGHSSGGIIGITLKEETLKVWALSPHLCCKIEEIGEATSSSRLFICFTNLIDLTVGQTKHIECLTQSILHQCQQVGKQEMTLKSHAIILEWFLCNNASKTPVVYRCSNVLCWVKSVRKGLILSIKSLFYLLSCFWLPYL